MRGGGRGEVGHPALADPEFARATASVVLEHAMELVDAVLDGKPVPLFRRAPFALVPILRTNFWPAVLAGVALVTMAAVWRRRR